MLVLPISSKIHALFKEIAETKRMIFMAGLPGVGKSLLIQQLAILAQQAGRNIHLLQWDVSRSAFEIPEILERYPEIEGVTDPIIRKGVGLWARTAVVRWHERYSDPADLLIGETPLVGNRLVELTQVIDDEAEHLLQSDQTVFLTPIPSWEVREVIEASRERTIAEPQHERERWDASPDVLRALWQEVNGLARQIRLTKVGDNAPYNPYIYAGVYEALLQNRPMRNVLVEEVLRPQRSVYDLDLVASVLAAEPAEALAIVQGLESDYGREELIEEVENWHKIATNSPKAIDGGPELILPLPSELRKGVDGLILTAEQVESLHKLVALPVETDADRLLPVIDHCLAVLAAEVEVTTAEVHKFDVYDSYFNVKRSIEEGGILFLTGMLQTYRQMLTNLETAHELTVVELPLLRIGLDTIVWLILEEQNKRIE